MAPSGLKLTPSRVVKKTLTIKLQDVYAEIRERLKNAGELNDDTAVEIRLVIDGKVRLLEDISGGHEIRLAWEV